MNQPPHAEYPRPDSGRFAGVRGPGVYFEAIGEAANLVVKDLGHWIAATVVYLVALFALKLPIDLVFGASTPATPRLDDLPRYFGILLLRAVVGIVPASIESILIVGMVAMGVRKLRGEYINVGMIFEPFRSFGKLFGTNLVYLTIVFAAALACVLPFFFFAPVLVLMPTVAYLKRLGPLEALGTTFDACKGQWAGLLALTLVLGLIQILGLCACGVGILVAFPIYCLVLAIHYRAFFESEPAPPIA